MKKLLILLSLVLATPAYAAFTGGGGRNVDGTEIHSIKFIEHEKDVTLPVIDEEKLKAKLRSIASEAVFDAIVAANLKGMLQEALTEAIVDVEIKNAVVTDIPVTNAIINEVVVDVEQASIKPKIEYQDYQVSRPVFIDKEVINPIVKDVEVTNAVITDKEVQNVTVVEKTVEVEKPVFKEVEVAKPIVREQVIKVQKLVLSNGKVIE